MSTPTQKRFNKEMTQINKESKTNDKVYSYIQDKFISSYYEANSNGRQRVKTLNKYKYSIVITAALFCFLVFIAAPYSKITAIPVTFMLSSIILIPFGLIHPSLAFLDGKSRFTVVWVYVLLFIVSFILIGLSLGVRFEG
ncbi:hypothetical protein [Paenibacillus macquariensis]|uniref:Permease n=1 Tax=Paenibacillus macquariensis TaxID=948756 RepID=A0ABY1JKF9_9BACL|nr:hypothetical protein [Paenibacillus macquariensis]OAB31189.1 hypothetical protein PMSM_20945 [Paenibacillus macquariensis subsp. macquariensis]SIQ34293.1 hypothetical protein SAMN05421578_101306 [Paenibacillus macquariensis]